MNPLVAIAIQEAPEVLAFLKDAFAKKNPDAPIPTDQEVIDAYQQAFASSILKDDDWLAAHPA